MSLYLDGKYSLYNPSWHEEDAPWKAAKILNLLKKHDIFPSSICEVGCGAGGILAELRDSLGPSCRLVGFDIALPLKDFWNKYKSKQITFIMVDFLQSGLEECYDLLLLVDLLEHIENPFNFLRQVLRRAKWFILHIPLDLHAQGAIRNRPLLKARHQLGHLHYWNKDLALLMIEECGMKVIQWEYTAGAIDLPIHSLQRRLGRWARQFFFALAPDWTARTLGGYSLMVLAKAPPYVDIKENRLCP